MTEITLDVIPHVRSALLEPQVPVASAQSQPARNSHALTTKKSPVNPHLSARHHGTTTIEESTQK